MAKETARRAGHSGRATPIWDDLESRWVHVPSTLVHLFLNNNSLSGGVDLTQLPDSLQFLFLGCNVLSGNVNLTNDALIELGFAKELPGNRFKPDQPKPKAAPAPPAAGLSSRSRRRPVDRSIPESGRIAGWLTMTTRGFGSWSTGLRH